MLLELVYTPTNFKNYINKFLANKLDVFVMIYLDYILIYTEDKSYFNTVF